MKKIKVLVLVVFLIVVLVAGVFFLVGYIRPKGAGILIETTPVAAVYIDGEQTGRTPYRSVLKPGDVVIRLIPESFDKPLAPYESTVSLISGVETVLRHDFGETEDLSGGELVTFEKVAGDEVGYAVVSIPDLAQVSFDGQIKGFSPYKSTSTGGKHKITVSAEGYAERSINVELVKGHLLTALVRLPKMLEVEEGVQEEKPGEEDIVEELKEVEIQPTGTNFLRVRSQPSLSGEEVGRVTPGEKYRLIEEEEETGWFRIEYEEGKEGWVSGEYATKVEIEEDVTTPTPTPTKSEES